MGTQSFSISYLETKTHSSPSSNESCLSSIRERRRGVNALGCVCPCQRFKSAQPTGVSILVCYLFDGVKSRAKNSKVAQDHMKHKAHSEFILVWASGE
jgi:hypothetical protein